MTSTAGPDSPNAEQVRYWNEVSGPTWVAAQDVLDALIGPVGEHALAVAAAHAGERVLDVGCGCGTTTLALARAVGSTGTVTGLDISGPMLTRARERAGEAGLSNVRFRQADAQIAALEPAAYDLLFSRFGVMFFADPVAAFRNLHGAMAPEGRLAFVCWQAITRNPWMLVPVTAAAQHLTLPRPDPLAPGPFAFADDARLRGILEDAGFREVAIADRSTTLRLGTGDLESATQFAMVVGPTASALREARADEALRTRVTDAVREALRPYHAADGVHLGGATWIVTARA